jgi:hypothetical protein
VVKNPLLDEAVGIRVEKGENAGPMTGIRVAHESA